MNRAERLVYGKELLGVIDRRREESESPGLGASIEREIVDRELRELEHYVLMYPADFEGELVPVLRKRADKHSGDAH